VQFKSLGASRLMAALLRATKRSSGHRLRKGFNRMYKGMIVARVEAGEWVHIS